MQVGPGRTGSGNLDSLAPRRFRRWRFIVLAVVSLAVALSARSLRAALAGQPVKAGAAHVGATSRATTLEAAAATDGVRRNIQHHTVTEQTFAAPTAAQPADAAVAAGLRRVPPALGTTSAKWQPLVLSECVEGMPRHWAPCLVSLLQSMCMGVGSWCGCREDLGAGVLPSGVPCRVGMDAD